MPSFRLNNSGFGFERNVCFVNSVLQFMAAVPIIRDYFLQKSFKCGLNRDYPLCSEIVRIFEMAGSRMITSAGVLRDMIGSMEGQERFSTKPEFGNQQDASDFLNVLVSKLENEVNCRGFEFGHSDNCMVPWFEGREQLEFKFLNSDDGSCPICLEFPDSTDEPFEVFHLYNNNSVATSIQELVWENLEQPTPLERRCSKCDYGQDQKATSFRSISQYPAVLFVHVPKFEINIRSRISDEFLTIGNERYELCTVLDHIGTSPHQGHWITWSKCQDGSGWIKCDDKDITDVLLEEKIYSRNNFLLAYLRVEKTFPNSNITYKFASPSPNPESPVLSSKQPKSTPESTVCTSKRSQTSPPSPSSTRASKSQKKDFSSTSSTTPEIKCRGCFRSFKLLMGHLSKSKPCQEFYDMDALRDNQKKRRLESVKEITKRFRTNQTGDDKAADNKKAVERMKNARANKTPDEKKKDKEIDARRKKNDRAAKSPDEKKKDKEIDARRKKNDRAAKSPDEKKKDKEIDARRKKNVRAAKSPDEKKKDKEIDAKRKKNERAAMTPDEKKVANEKTIERVKNIRDVMTSDEKEEENEKAAERMRNLRAEKGKDPLYKQNVATMKAKYRHRVFKSANETAIGRYRVFLETVRDGPIYGCVSCHRLLYNNAVVEIKSMEDFEDKLNEIKDGFFDQTISAAEIPSLKGKYYICLTCKNHIYNSRMPPMNQNNNLKIFDSSNAPQMNLSELEASCIARNLLFMKIHNLPRSGMKGIIDKTICVPIDSETINNTITSFPRTPQEASLVPIKLKRKQSYKNTHLQEYVNPRKMIAALEFLKLSGHKYYQFEFESSIEDYLERCDQDLEDGEPSNDDSSSSSSSSDDISSRDSISDNSISSSSRSEFSPSSDDVDKSKNSDDNDKLDKLMKPLKYNLKTRMKEAQEDEEEYLKVDPSGKFQFNYNRVTAFSNNYPEINVGDQPLIIAPGEGKKPISMLMEDDWDLKSHPHLDPTGLNSMNSERKVRLTNVQYVEQRLKNVNPTYANCFSWLFACKNLIELKQLTTRVNMSVMRGNKKVVNGKTTYGLDDAFQVFDGISGTSRFWQKKKMELQAMVENLGSFHLFFTLSAADSRYPENFTSLLQDHKITYVYREGREECLIDGLTIDEFIQQNSTKFEFIRENILTATRNYNFRVKSFIKIVVMNIYSELRCKYYSYRVEFQLRGSAHIHGVLFLDIDKIVKIEMKKGYGEYEFLKSALRKCQDNEIPSEIENRAIVSFVDKFVTCSLQDPRSSKIAASVQRHHHTFTCRKAGSKCRFNYPRFPSLHTILAKPLRNVFKNVEDDEKRKAMVMKIRSALGNVRTVLENKEEMEIIEKLWADKLEEIFNERDAVQRSQIILEDAIFKQQILNIDTDYVGEVDDKLGGHLIDNLKSLHEEHKVKLNELESHESKYLQDRLLQVLKKANIDKILEIDENLPEEDRVKQLVTEYHKLLSFSVKGYSVVLKRDISEIYINNFNSEWLPVWNSNMDISPVFDYHAVVVYVSDYFMKSDEKIIKILLDAVKEIGHKSLKDKLKVMRDVFLTHRSMGECELYYRLIPSMHLTDSNIATVFIHTGLKKSRFLRKCEDGDSVADAVGVEDREGLFIESSSIHDKYIKRPSSMHYLPLIQFARRYSPLSSSVKQDEFQSEEENNDLEIQVESSDEEFENSIEQDFIICRDPSKRRPLGSVLALVGSFYQNEPRFMKLRMKPLVIRIHKYKMDTETHDYCLSQLELFYIFKDEDERKKCEDDIEFCYDTYMSNQEDINYVKRKSMPFMNYVEEAMDEARDIMHNNIGETLDPENEKLEADCEHEGVEDTETFVAFEHGGEESDKDSLPADKMFKRIEINEIEILSQMTRVLDNDQMYVVHRLIDYAKSYKRSRITAEPIPEPVTLKVFGNAGTGKSHVINIVAQWIEFILRQEGDNIDCPYVIKCAFTGSASSAIDGQTLHRAFSLTFADKIDDGKYKSLNDKTKEKMTTVLKNLRLVIIDEFSMIKPEHLYQIDLRLREIKHLSKEFGGCCLLLMGDPMQLKPVQGRYAWDDPTAKQYQLAHQLKSIWESFEPVILRTNHRQGADFEFAEVLNRIRIREFTEKDIEFLQSRVVKGNDSKIPADRMYIFARNKEVNEMNEVILRKMTGELFQVDAIVHHSTMKGFEPMVKNTGFIVDTSLMKTLSFKINSKVLLTYNINVVDGMCNGSFCKIVGIKRNNQGNIIEIHVQFLNPSHGVETSREFPHLAKQYGFPVVPIKRMEQKLRIRGKVLGTVLQYPLKLSDSVTSHRVQGQTVRDPTAVVVDLKHCRDPGQVYVTLSRAQKLSQLFILDNLYTDNWKTSADALLELRDSEKEALNTIKKDDNNLEIITMNIRSLRKSYADVVRSFEFQPSDVICLQETWLMPGENPSKFTVGGMIPWLNSVGLGKGLATYCSSPFKLKQHYCLDDCQLTKITSEKLEIINVYRSSQCRVFEDELAALINVKKPTIVCGDTNTNVGTGSCRLMELMTNLGFKQLVTGSTHDKGGCIDQVFVNSFLNAKVEKTRVQYTDHDQLRVILKDFKK